MGICEDKDTLFVALEDTDDCLKQILLDSRALVHHPVFAEKNSTTATVDEAAIFQYLIGVARGMNHLSNLRVKLVPHSEGEGHSSFKYLPYSDAILPEKLR